MIGTCIKKIAVSLTIFCAVFLKVDFSIAQDSKIDVSGRVEFTAIASEFRDSSFIPPPPDEKNADHQLLSTVVLNAKYDQGQFRFTSNGRVKLGRRDDVSNSRVGNEAGHLDELYVEYAPTFSTVLFGGRRNMAFGHSLALNPSDVFKEKRHYSRNRAESKGTDKIGLEYFSESGNTVRAIWAPSTNYLNDGISDRIYSSFETQVGESYSDVLLYALYSDRPGGGGAFATTTDVGILFYADAGVRYGGMLPQVSQNENTRLFSVSEPDGEEFTYEATAGINYSFVNGFSIYAELSHLSGGYDSDEWSTYVDAFSNSRSPEILGELGKISRNDFLRQNYFFMRLHHSDFFGKIEPAFTLLLGLQDFTGNVGLELSRGIGENYKVRGGYDRNFGGDESEFSRGTEQGVLKLSLEALF